MIKDLNLANSILTFDAINTRAAALKAVTEADADFLVCLKKYSVNGLTLKVLSELIPQEPINAQVSPIQMM